MTVLIATANTNIASQLQRQLQDCAFSLQHMLMCQTYAQLLQHCQTQPVEMVIIDQDLPGLDGLCGLEHLKKATTSTNIVLFAQSSQNRLAEAAMHHGVLGILHKNLPHTALRGALMLMLAGQRYIPAELALPNQTPPKLGPRQIRTLHLIANGYSNKDIARQLTCSPETVKKNITAMLRQFGASNRTQLVRTAMALGLLKLPH